MGHFVLGHSVLHPWSYGRRMDDTEFRAEDLLFAKLNDDVMLTLFKTTSGTWYKNR